LQGQLENIKLNIILRSLWVYITTRFLHQAAAKNAAPPCVSNCQKIKQIVVGAHSVRPLFRNNRHSRAHTVRPYTKMCVVVLFGNPN